MISLTAYKNLMKNCEQARDLTGLLHGLLGSISMSAILDSPIYKPEYFKIQEFVPPEIFSQFGEKSLWFMDVRMVQTADALRDYFGKPVFVNTWNSGGQFKYRGFRPAHTPNWTGTSQHDFGRAIDCDVDGVSANDVRTEIILHKTDPAFRYITAIEDAVNWLHADCRNTNQDAIMLFKP